MKIIRLNNVLAVRLETEKRYKLAEWSVTLCRQELNVFNCYDCCFNLMCINSRDHNTNSLNLLLKGVTL